MVGLIQLITVSLIFTACGTPPVAPAPATPQAVFLTYPPELRPYADTLAACARQYPHIALYLEETVEQLSPDQHTSLFLAIGGQPTALAGWHATLLSDEHLTVIVNRQNSLTTLTAAELRAIWSGDIPSWQALGGNEGDIQVWTYPAGSHLRQFFDSLILTGELTTSRAWLAPDPQALLEAVYADQHAIGYLPASWLVAGPPELIDSIQPISLPQGLEDTLHQPVIALTESQPQGALRTLLLCSQ